MDAADAFICACALLREASRARRAMLIEGRSAFDLTVLRECAESYERVASQLAPSATPDGTHVAELLKGVI